MTLSEEMHNSITRQLLLFHEVRNRLVEEKGTIPDKDEHLAIYAEINKDLRQALIYKKRTVPDKGREYYCSTCAKQIEPKVAHYSKEHFDERLCRDCQKKVETGDKG